MKNLTKSDRRELIKRAIEKMENATEANIINNESKDYIDTNHFSLIHDAIDKLKEFLKVYV